MLETKHVAAAIIYADGKIFAAQRAAGPQKDGWEFPGGKIEPGETSEEACRREIAEELGVRLTTMWLLDTIEYDYPDFHLSMDCFVSHLDEGEKPKLLVHEAGRWLAHDEILSVPWLEADRTLVNAIGLAWDDIFADAQF